VIPRDLTVINALCVGNEDTSDNDPGTLKQQPAEEVYPLDPKGNKRYRDPQTGIWDTPLTRRHARMCAELRGANQEVAYKSESETVYMKLADPKVYDNIDPPYTGLHTVATVTPQDPTVGTDLQVTTNSTKDQHITAPTRTYLDTAKPWPSAPADRQWHVNSVRTDVKNGAYEHNPNGTDSPQYHIPEDNPDTTELNKQNDISLKDPGILKGIKLKHTPPTYQIFPAEVTNTADSTKVQDNTYQTELTPPSKGHNRTMNKNALASLTNTLSVTAFNYMDTGQQEPPGAKTQHDYMRSECKVNFPIDHLDQAESYPVDEDNPIDDAAKEYKIYSTSN
jgi:hypothetical protein